MDTCAVASLLYCCETWATCTFTKLEALYRKGIKYALSIRASTNNEIIYLESNRVPLSVQITKRQLLFWKTLQKHFRSNPENPLKKLIDKAELVNLKYINHYKNLSNIYDSPKHCQDTLIDTFRVTNTSKIRTKATSDPDSKLGAYLKVNTELINVNCHNLYEPDRVIISCYRTGSHNLLVETGRMCNPIIPRADRIC